MDAEQIRDGVKYMQQGEKAYVYTDIFLKIKVSFRFNCVLMTF